MMPNQAKGSWNDGKSFKIWIGVIVTLIFGNNVKAFEVFFY